MLNDVSGKAHKVVLQFMFDENVEIIPSLPFCDYYWRSDLTQEERELFHPEEFPVEYMPR